MVLALQKELILRTLEFKDVEVQTIYFGGGTPSVLEVEDIELLIDTVYDNYTVSQDSEITLEANPDDLTIEKIQQLSRTRINRLSIGIQSFFDTDLQLMNRAHKAEEAHRCIEDAKLFFDNISIDLIYGIPGMDIKRWEQNLKKAITLEVPHISSYALTVEPKTALKKLIEKGTIAPVSDVVSKAHYDSLLTTMETNGYINYEFSNFGKEGYFSRNNTAYWIGKPYLGIGPSAHSFNGTYRSWNVSNNSKYINAIEEDFLPSEKEWLSLTDRYNEYVMTGLRTQFGVSLYKVENEFGPEYLDFIKKEAKKHLEAGFLEIKDSVITTTKKGKFLTDGLASDLFFLN